MTHTQLFEALPYLMRSGRPAYIQGPPGCGKSAGVQTFADSIGYSLISESAVTWDTTDIKGLPGLDKETKTAKWFPPDLIRRLRMGPTILFWDDLPCATPIVQSSLFRCMLERYIGDEKLPDNCYVMAAGNRSIDAAATQQMPTPMRNRLVHIEMEISLDDYCRNALKKGFHTSTIAFPRLRPDLLYKFDKTRYAFPTYRTWEFTSDIVKQNPPENILPELVKGCLGEETGVEYCGFLRMFKEIPSIDAIMMAPLSVEVPTNPAVLYALSTALAKKSTADNFAAVTTYTNRMPTEFGVLAVQDAITVNPAVSKTRAFIDWATQHQNVLM